MIHIKREVLISVSYIVEVEQAEFWDKESGGLTNVVESGLERNFPENIELAPAISANRESLSYIPIDSPNLHVSKCPICKHLITCGTTPIPTMIMRKAKKIEGIWLCSSCAWEIDFDLKKGKSIESIIKSFEQ